jgi:hypothetical protein
LLIIIFAHRSEVGRKSQELLELFLQDFKQAELRNLELDKEIIEKLTRFLKEEKQSNQGKGLREALYWLNKFITYFEHDYRAFLDENQELMSKQDEELTLEDKEIKDKQREFLGNMYEHQFPDIIEIILIYSQRKES